MCGGEADLFVVCENRMFSLSGPWMAEKRPQTGQPLLRAIGFDSTYTSEIPSFTLDFFKLQLLQ